ncbi:MAG: NHL repeat-containing protein, partial [Candidatus Jorgensenbacteria bacterium]|nr:NHL repeat-containing protein [Candidatus Jorgensenbacteria bacterium]
NTTSTGNYYTYTAGGGWAISAVLESTKQTPTMASDGGQSTASYEVGSSLALTPMSVLTRASAQGGLTVSNASPVTFAMSGYTTATTTLTGGSVKTTGSVPTFGGNKLTFGTAGTGTSQFTVASFASIDATNNKVYAIDNGYTNYNRLVRFDSGTGVTPYGANWETFGSYGTGTNMFKGPTYLAIDSANNKLYLVDSTNNRLIRVDSGGGSTTFGANWVTTSTSAFGVTVDVTNNKIFLTDWSNRIIRMDSGGGSTTFGANMQTFGTTGSGTNNFNGPRGIAVDAINNKLYIVDGNNFRIIRMDSGGGSTTFGANWEAYGTSYVNGSPGQFSDSYGISVDPVNNKVFIGHNSAFQIVMINSGSGGTSFGGNWTTISSPTAKSVSVDYIHNKIYSEDNNNSIIIRVDSGFGNLYASSGIYTSGSVDIGQTTTSWGSLSWVNSGSGTITMKARSSATSNFSGATAWGSCTSLSSGQSLYTGNCVTTGHRYIQFQATLSTSDTSVTPSLDSVNIGYTY